MSMLQFATISCGYPLISAPYSKYTILLLRLGYNVSLHAAPILIVEDSPTLGLTYKTYLKSIERDVHIVETGTDALKFIKNTPPAVVLLDLVLPDMDGLDILRYIQEQNISSKVIVITAHGSVSVAVNAMREGAVDFILKPFNANRLIITVKNAFELRRLNAIVERFTSGMQHRSFGKFIGESPAMQAVYRMIEGAAPSNASVFIEGESGTGKELCANSIHQLSGRNKQPFIELNCAAIPTNLIESEVFGHKRGSFTGATEDREGAASKADGGTLFLDEICEMPLDLQVKLLRFIQSGQITPVGDSISRAVNVRFICATNRNPWKETQEGRFREDLYYRLHVIPIHMPPLKKRGNDILQIASALLQQYAAEEGKSFKSLSQQSEAALLAYSWPGNVRELSNIIQSAIVMNDGEILHTHMLPSFVTKADLSGSSLSEVSNALANDDTLSSSVQGITPLHIAEQRIIEQAISKSGGSVGRAAKALMVNPSTLYRKIKSWQNTA